MVNKKIQTNKEIALFKSNYFPKGAQCLVDNFRISILFKTVNLDKSLGR